MYIFTITFSVCALTTVFTEVVKTPSGPIRGKTVDIDNEIVYQFFGIPYAKSPTSSLRFRKPQPMSSWSYTLDATNHPPSCLQTIDPFLSKFLPTLETSEDCLFLNIYVPRDVSLSNNKAVMVWIHGGGFFSGQASMYDGTDFALKGDVIVITINYRLGFLGFFTTDDSASPGNYGLWDQRMAIEWVRSNIAAFGGNPSMITIFGESAGGISVAYQTLIPYNRGLLQRAIQQSGSANMFPPISPTSRQTKKLIGNITNCVEHDNTFIFVDCLRHLSSDKMLNMTDTIIHNAMTHLTFKLIFGPSIDGDLFTADPSELLRDTSSSSYNFFKSLDVMAGTTDGEGGMYVFLISIGNQNVNVTEGLPSSVLCDVVAPLASEEYYGNRTVISDAICKQCAVLDGDKHLHEQGVQIANFFGDLLFVSPTVETLDTHCTGNFLTNSYQYLVSKYITVDFGPPIPWYKKSPHGTDIMYLFGAKHMFSLINNTYTEDDQKMADIMVSYWSNFAKTRNPNSEGLPYWPKYDMKDKSYIQLDHTISANQRLFSDRINFIQNELRDLLKAETSRTKSREEL